MFAVCTFVYIISVMATQRTSLKSKYSFKNTIKIVALNKPST
jgi:hypothetical protein